MKKVYAFLIWIAVPALIVTIVIALLLLVRFRQDLQTNQGTANNNAGNESCPVGYRLMADESCSALCSENNGVYTLEPVTDGGEAISFRMVAMPIGDGISFFTGTGDTGNVIMDTPYDIAETELTYAVWERVRAWAVHSDRGNARYDFSVGNRGSTEGDDNSKDDHPVTSISWYDSVKFANALSEFCAATGTQPLYRNGAEIMRSGTDAPAFDADSNGSAKGFRLPSSEEWELAARYIQDWNNDGDITDLDVGGNDDSDEYYPGNYASGANAPYTDRNVTREVGWFNNVDQGDSNAQAHLGKQKSPNALGLFDMSGNVWEWVFDCFLGICTVRVFRGGSWIGSANYLQVGYVFFSRPDIQNNTIGIRLARS